MISECKNWWESKTIWWNILMMAPVVLAAPELVAVIPVEAMPYILALSAVINVFLRFATVAPVRV